MAYMKKSIRELVEKMKCEFYLPNEWYLFLKDIEEKDNIIIKTKNSYYCTNCQQTFTYLNKGPEIKTKTKCNHCKNEYFVRSNKLKNWKTKENILLLDKVDNQLIIRIFEMLVEYNSHLQEMEYSTVEYARKIIDDDYAEIRNDRVSIAQCGPFVLHNIEAEGEWRLYNGNWYESTPAGYLYPNNLKEILKDTVYEHSRLWEYVKNSKNEWHNLKELLKEAKYESFEVLIEMKLYNLAYNARTFYCKGSFKNIFGISKEFYPFMKKHDITLEQLNVLKLYQKKDIKNIRFLTKYSGVIEDIKEYTSLDNFIKYFKRKKKSDPYLYRDYLGFAKQLGLDLKNKKHLFPNKLKTMHDKYEKQIEIIKKQNIAKEITKRVEELSKNIFKNSEFIIFPASSLESLIEESKQQNNCVRTYAEKYAEGQCDIYFLRKIDKPEQSLVTVEVQDNKVVQKRTKNNAITNKKQENFLNIWQKRKLKGVAV